MSYTKKQRARGIIFYDNKIISMYRELDNRIFYTFPGGGMEEGESETECVVREIFEEFGLVVKPLKKVYVYENEKSIEYFYICEWIEGKFGTGNGEEFEPQNNNGVYKPMLINILDIPSLPLMPPEIAKAFFEDYNQNGKILRSNVKVVNKE